jgi:hypothetical protein
MAGTIITTCRIGVVVSVVSAVFCLETQAVVTYRTVAMTGDAVPGTDAGIVFTSFDTPVHIGAAGATFRAVISGPGVNNTNDSGIWAEDLGPLSLIARTGETPPGTDPAVVYSSLGVPVGSRGGHPGFRATVMGFGVDSTNDTGIWSQRFDGNLLLVARTGDPAPDTDPGVVYSGLTDPALDGSGRTAFMGTVTGPGVDGTNDTGIWSERSNSLRLVSRTGDAAPGTDPGVVFSDPFNPTFDSSLTPAFKGSLFGPGIDETNNTGIWGEIYPTIVQRIQEGGAAAGTEPGVIYSNLGQPTITGRGGFGLKASLVGPGVIDTNDTGIWLQDTQLFLVAREGASAPGTTATYDDFSEPVFSSVYAAFKAVITGPDVDSTNDRGIWSGRGTWSGQPASPGLLIRSGNPAPGTSAGVVFADFGDPLLDKSNTVFRGTLTGTGVDPTNNEGVWATNLAGVLSLVVRKGDLFDVDYDLLVEDLRTISSIDLITGNSSSNGQSISYSSSRLVFRLGFTDGSEGVFAATIGVDGDLDGDGFVGISDLGNVLGNWNATLPPGVRFIGDPSGDGFVGIDDLNTVLGNWNTGSPAQAGTAIPEPGTLAIFTVVGLAMLRRRVSA